MEENPQATITLVRDFLAESERVNTGIRQGPRKAEKD
jgi:hypothetical protein